MPDVAGQVHSQHNQDLSLHISANRTLYLLTSPPVADHITRKKVPQSCFVSREPSERCLPAYSATALLDIQDQAAHKLLRPSTHPAARRSSPGFALHRLPLAHPASPPAHADTFPTDSLAGSALHN